MIRKLQRKFIAITMVSLLLVMAVVLGAVNLANVYHMNQRADGLLSMLAENGGSFPEQQGRHSDRTTPEGQVSPKDKEAPEGQAPPEDREAFEGPSMSGDQTSSGGQSAPGDQLPSGSQSAPGDQLPSGGQSAPGTIVTPGGAAPGAEPAQQMRRIKPGGFKFNEETPFETRYFTVRTDLTQAVTEVNTGHIAAISASEARQYAREALKSGRTQGYRGSYRYLVTTENDSLLLIFVDCRTQIDTVMTFLRNSCAIAVTCLVVVLILVSVLSKRAIRPVIENMEKQKRFITDAGHEIKTPLAIISANNDVIEMTCGKSEWTTSIHNQVERLSELVKYLLTLSRMEEDQLALIFSDVDFTNLVRENAWAFVPLAEKKGVALEMQIQPDVSVQGDETGLSHLVTILTDNAVKYCNEGGNILITLSKRGKGCCLEITNTCSDMPQGDLSRLFDRFYRADESRSRESGGYGIGLSVAQAVAGAHGGRISAARKEGQRICFTVEL